MDQHSRHLAPIRRRERKTVYADSRWKISVILPQAECGLQYQKREKQEENKCASIL